MTAIYHHFADIRHTVATTARLRDDYRNGLLTREEFIDLSEETLSEGVPRVEHLLSYWSLAPQGVEVFINTGVQS